jgi:hypothetical protein
MSVKRKWPRLVVSLCLVVAAIALSLGVSTAEPGNRKCDCYWLSHWGTYEVQEGIPLCMGTDCWVPLAD